MTQYFKVGTYLVYPSGHKEKIEQVRDPFSGHPWLHVQGDMIGHAIHKDSVGEYIYMSKFNHNKTKRYPGTIKYFKVRPNGKITTARLSQKEIFAKRDKSYKILKEKRAARDRKRK